MPAQRGSRTGEKLFAAWRERVCHFASCSRVPCLVFVRIPLIVELVQKNMRSSLYVVVVCLCSISLLGCGNRSKKETAAVSGTVTYEGNPVAEGIVQFVPTGEGYLVEGQLDSEGAYRLISQDGGVPLGEYRVQVLPPTVRIPDSENGPGGEGFKKVDNIPNKYRSSETSGLQLKVEKGSQTFDISMTK